MLKSIPVFPVIPFLVILILSSCNKRDRLPDPLEAGWKGEKVCRVLFEDDKIRVLKCSFEPGVGHEKHYHKPHFGYTLIGSLMEITDTNSKREINILTGSNFNSEGIEWQHVLNIGDSTAEFLIIEPK